jgi:hypothetical protein
VATKHALKEHKARARADMERLEVKRRVGHMLSDVGARYAACMYVCVCMCVCVGHMLSEVGVRYMQCGV